MMTFRYSALIPAPVEAVWDLMVDPARLIEWNTELADVRDVSGPLDHVGAGYRQVFRLAGRPWENPDRWAVVAVDPYRGRQFRGTFLGSRVIGRDSFEPVPHGTRLTVEMEYRPPLGIVGRLLDPMLRRQLRRTLARNSDRLSELLVGEGGAR
jgi:ligand-binding SRPBCC domain-containing protein